MRFALTAILLACGTVAANDPDLPGPVPKDHAKALYDANSGKLYFSANSALIYVDLDQSAASWEFVPNMPHPDGVDWIHYSSRQVTGLVNGNVADWHVGTFGEPIPFDVLEFSVAGRIGPEPVVSRCNDGSGLFSCVPEPISAPLHLFMFWGLAVLARRHKR